MLALAVSVAAGLGAVLRYVVDQLVQRRTDGDLPYGTFVVNVTGSFLLGLLTGLLRADPTSEAAVVLGLGVLGGYTTLSTWAWESLTLVEAGALSRAALNVLGSFAAGLAAAGAGLALGSV